ncbi:helix-turn-helix transcriptional regulator [Brachybacterium sacelli]|uniref:AraC-like DNA-binding protein n=1 Tax=Brachybacterium sacelli TaxID=173364 RepID=A0ABS4WZ80_9MICO|nr:helix-turn-helix transcriptional regulator [Brachybacterium sacelli]MBP2381509.1 AraC-like DNA-binding protein [Brachybacterium sacelli]
MTLADLTLTESRPAQLADYPAGASYGPRRLPDFELVWLVTGSARLTLEPGPARADAYGCTLLPGDLAITRPGDRDHYAWDPRVPSRHAYLHFTVDALGHLPDPMTWPPMRSFSDFPVLESLCDYLLALAGDDGASARQRSSQVLHWLVDLYVTGPLPNDPMAGLPTSVGEALERVREIWTREGLRLIHVGELADDAHVSAAHLHRVFKASLGTGPARCLELVRLWQAATALQRSSATVSDVGALCGYPDRFHFSRRFRHLYAMSPREARFENGALDPAGPLRRAGLLGLAQKLLAPTRPT